MNTEQKIGYINENKREKQNRLLLYFQYQGVVTVKAFLEDIFLSFHFYQQDSFGPHADNSAELIVTVFKTALLGSRSETFVVACR
jgi:hypothetical protein